jgi:lysophospholipase L1-like esterase
VKRGAKLPQHGVIKILKTSSYYVLIILSFVAVIFGIIYIWNVVSSNHRIATDNLDLEDQAAFIEKSYHYVALGDSYAAGQTPYGTATGYSYTDIIKEKLELYGYDVNYSKMGVSGYTSVDIIKQLENLNQILYNAEIVTIDIGINDLLLLPEILPYIHTPPAKSFDEAQSAATKKMPEIAANIKKIIIKIKEINPDSDPQIYIMGYFNAFPDSPEFLPIILSLNESIHKIAIETGVTYVDTMAAMNEKLREYLPGDFHPTIEGYRAIADEFWEAIQKDLTNTSPEFNYPNDISGHWAEKDILTFFGKGIVTGYADGTFKPDHTITRGEFVTIMNKFFNFSIPIEIGFDDVPEGAWYEVELQKAMKAGFISGYNDNTFKADNYVTRQEAAVMIAKILKLDLSESKNEIERFIDWKEVPAWSRDSINALIRTGILTGYPDNSIRFQGYLTRAEVLSMLNHLPEII